MGAPHMTQLFAKLFLVSFYFYFLFIFYQFFLFLFLICYWYLFWLSFFFIIIFSGFFFFFFEYLLDYGCTPHDTTFCKAISGIFLCFFFIIIILPVLSFYVYILFF
eukprot:Phypoly_transcript_22672.p1 GENE.Phypoly_transcript_22672~~Phypoly_transcript_22672.p1  ORF type:complete len:106 (+),score=3.94 Phypoly_transcript_22672:46-363(+)